MAQRQLRIEQASGTALRSLRQVCIMDTPVQRTLVRGDATVFTIGLVGVFSLDLLKRQKCISICGATTRGRVTLKEFDVPRH